MDYLKAVLLAVVEGITEFLPISSTGHLILLEDFLRLGDDPVFAKAFVVVIQLPAILAVVVYFWDALWPFGAAKDTPRILRLWTKIAAAFLPAAILGLVFDDFIEEKLFNPITVAIALAVGGIVLIVIERRGHRERIATTDDIGYGTAVAIGFFQCLAMIPGTSRSAATIIGAMVLGARRSAAAEFSFFLAIPTMLGATTLTVAKMLISDGRSPWTGQQWALVGLGSVVSFVIAYAVVAWLMYYIRRHTFEPFGYYRIALGVLVIILFWA